MDDGQIILVAGTLLAAAIGASLLAGRLRIPGLLLFLGIGMAVGSDGTGWIEFNDYEVARSVGIVALALILFEGGLASGWREIRPVIGPAAGLAVAGTLITAIVTGLAASWLFGLDTLDGLLLGAVLSSTDGAAVFALLRGSALRRRLARTLEGEAGLNDPIAVLLVLGFIDWITLPDSGAAHMAGLLVTEMGIGLLAGLGVGMAAVAVLRRTQLASAGLYPVASMAVAAISYGAADAAHGSGFLAVYVTGLAIGSASVPAKRTIETFHDGMAWLAQLVMFLVLGLLVFPARLVEIALEATLLALVLALVARPLGAWVGTSFSGFAPRERLVLGWAGLRGAVPVVLATFPVIAGVPGSERFFDIAFFAVVVSTLLQGMSFERVARALDATGAEPALPLPLIDVGAIRRLGAEVVEFAVRPGDAAVGARVRDLALPRDALLNLIIRSGQALPPRGSSLIEAGDRLHMLVRQEAALELRELFDRWRAGPLAEPPPARTVRAYAPPFTLRPWSETEDDGAPGRPAGVAGTPVSAQLRTRRDGPPGAVVVLEDGRYAFTGPVVAVGPLRPLRDAAWRRLRKAQDDAERAWWREVIGALAAPEERRVAGPGGP